MVKISNHIPRKGTETDVGAVRPSDIALISNHIPRKGTETRIRELDSNSRLLNISNHIPRKGTETPWISPSSF